MKLQRGIVFLLVATVLLSLSGCSDTLTETEIQKANEAFFWMDMETGEISEISCFFMSYYAAAEEIDLEAFLRYCPLADDLTAEDTQEYQSVLRAAGVPNPEAFPTPEDYVVPVHRYPADQVSALLTKYAGITVQELKNRDNIVYLEEYDSYYNFTSDAGPGVFECAGGERRGDTLRFWSAKKENGRVDVLTLVKDSENWFIRSFLEESAP